MKKLISAFLALTCVLIFVGCGDNTSSGTQIDKNKTQIYVGVYNGGYGYDWIQKGADKWNARPENQNYQIMIVPDTDDEIFPTNVKAGTNIFDMYFSTQDPDPVLINDDLLLDVSDLLDVTYDGDTKSIGDKLLYKDQVLYSMGRGDKLYALPYGDSIAGFVFDFDLFKEKGWLFYQTDSEGNVIFDDNNQPKLTVGRDGVYNTYDDGQPDSIAQWNEMIEKILLEPYTYVFDFTTKHPFYTKQLIDAMFAQYSGPSDFDTFIKFDGDYTDKDGNKVTITPENGFKAYEMPGLEKSVWFLDEYLTNNQRYVLPGAWETTSFTHKDAQNALITGFKQNVQNPTAALLVEGAWWENESRTMFKSLVDNGYSDRGYGKREYRFMLLPMIDGSKGGNGDGTGSVLSAMDCGMVYALKSKNQEKNDKIKDFLAYTCSDEMLKEFTTSNGSIRPFDYTLNDDEYNKLTPFQKNVWTMYHDTENITIIRPSFIKPGTKMFQSKKILDRYQVSTAYTQLFSYLRRNDYKGAVQALKEQNSMENWKTFYDEIK